METVEVESESPKTSCTAEADAEERPSSPVNDCAICLEQLTDKSFTNSCFHMFCFHCLKAWSKVKPECPLCKQDFCSIIHNIRSMDDYDEYRVPPAPMRFASPDSSSLFATSLGQNTLSLPFRDLLRQRDFFSPGRRFFSYRTTYIPGPYNVPRERSSRLVIQPYVDNLQIQSSYPSISTSSSHTSDLTSRKNVYLKDLELRPSNDGRHRLSSPEFYRENEGQLHRLGRWVNRELAVVLQLGAHFDPSLVFSLIMERLPNYDIQSAMFHNSLYPHLGGYTRRFIKEFYNFAISPYDMEEYDRMSVYITQRTGSSLAFIVTVGSDESEEVQVIPSSTINHSTVQPWINLTRLPSSSYNLENSTRLSSSTSTCSHLPTTSASSSRISTSQQVIDISDSENDDCIIIDEVKTTPQTIVLDDSDNESPGAGIAPKSPIPSTSGYRPPSKTDIYDNGSLLSSTSNHDSKFSIAATSSENCCTKNFYAKCNSTKRSPSSSSVISTDNSIVDRESDKESKERKRKNLKPKKVDTHRTSFDSYLSSSDSSFDCDDDNDSDWEANPKKKKKIKKHSDRSDKKTRKRKKTQHKSPKRKKRTDSESTHKSKRISKSHKSKKSSKSTAESHSNSSTLKSTSNGSLSASSKYETNNFSPIRPKLRSVVKKVERNDYVDDNVPSTSFGVRYNGSNQMQTFLRRTFYSSDSD